MSFLEAEFSPSGHKENVREIFSGLEESKHPQELPMEATWQGNLDGF